MNIILGLFDTATVPVDNNMNNLWLRIMQCLAQGNEYYEDNGIKKFIDTHYVELIYPYCWMMHCFSKSSNHEPCEFWTNNPLELALEYTCKIMVHWHRVKKDPELIVDYLTEDGIFVE